MSTPNQSEVLEEARDWLEGSAVAALKGVGGLVSLAVEVCEGEVMTGVGCMVGKLKEVQMEEWERERGRENDEDGGKQSGRKRKAMRSAAERRKTGRELKGKDGDESEEDEEEGGWGAEGAADEDLLASAGGRVVSEGEQQVRAMAGELGPPLLQLNGAVRQLAAVAVREVRDGGGGGWGR